MLRPLIEEEVSWHTLRHDRERHVYREAFMLGAAFGLDSGLEGRSCHMRLLSRMWRVMRHED